VTLLRGKKGLTAPLSKVIALTLAAYLFLPMGMDGKVLCLGENGHVAVESVGGACCGHDASGDMALYMGDVCGPCLDIPFLSVAEHKFSSRQALQSRHAVSPIQALLVQADLFARSPGANPHPGFWDNAKPLVQLQRSVILLT